MFDHSKKSRTRFKSNLALLKEGEAKAYIYMQESKDINSRRFFFITKKIEYTSLNSLEIINRFLNKKLAVSPFLRSALYSVGIARKDSNDVLNLEPKKKKGIQGSDILKSIKKLRGFQKLLKGTYIYSGNISDSSSEPLLELDENIAPTDETKLELELELEDAIDQNNAALEYAIQKKAKKNKRNIVRGVVNILKKGRNILGGIKDKIGDTLQAVASLRPMIEDGRLKIRADADELFDLVDLSSILEFDKEAADNHVEIEIIKFPAKEIIIRSIPSKIIALKNLNINGVRLQSVNAKDIEIHLIQSSTELSAKMNIGTLEGTELERVNTTIDSFSLTNIDLELSKKGDLSSMSAKLDTCNFSSLVFKDTDIEHGVMKDMSISLEQSKKEQHFTLHSDEIHSQKVSNTRKKQAVDIESVDGQDFDLDYIKKEGKEGTIEGDMSDVHAEGIDVQSDTMSVDIDQSDMRELDFTLKDDQIHVEAKDIHTQEVHVEKDYIQNSKTEEERAEDSSRLLKQVGAMIDDAQIKASVPLTGELPSSFLYGKKDTTAHIKSTIKDGKIMPGALDFRLDKNIRTPLLVAFRGAYLDKKGRLRVNLKNFFDIGIGSKVAKYLGIPSDKICDVPEITQSIAQRLLQPSSGNPFVDNSKAKAEGDIHLNEGVIDVDEDLHIELGGGDEHNHINLQADLENEILVTLQELLLQQVEIRDQGVTLSNNDIDEAHVHVTPKKKTIVDVHAVETESFSFDSQNKSP